MKTLTERISDDFVSELKKAGIRQVEISINFQLTQGQVSKIFKGVKSFTLDKIVEISSFYHIPIAGVIARNVYDKKVGDELLKLFDKVEKVTFELDGSESKIAKKRAVS